MANALKAYLMAEAQGRGALGQGIARGFERRKQEELREDREQRDAAEFDRRFGMREDAYAKRSGREQYYRGKERGLGAARSLVTKLSDQLRGFDNETNQILTAMKNARMKASGGLGGMDPAEIKDFLQARAQQKAKLQELTDATTSEAERRFPGQWFGNLPFGTLSGEELVGSKTVSGGEGQHIGGGFRFTPGTMSVKTVTRGPVEFSEGDVGQQEFRGLPPVSQPGAPEIDRFIGQGAQTSTTTYDPSNVFDIARGEQKVPDALLRAQRAAERAFAEEDDFGGGGGVGGARPGALTSQQIQSILPQTVTGTGATMMITPEQLQRLNQALQPPQDARFLGRHSRGQEDPTQEQLRLMEAFGGNVGTSTALRNMLLTDPVLGRKK